MSYCLTDQELYDLTKKTRPSAQARVLDGTDPPIPYRRRPDGTLIVFRIHAEPHGTHSARLAAPEPEVQPYESARRARGARKAA